MIGKEISHYRILEQLGAGGMGVVYKALDTKLNRNVALKFLPHALSFNPDIKQRFKIEAQSAAALNHPNIATIHSTEEIDNETFIVMEFLEGEELSKKIEKGPLDVIEALDIAIQIAEGLREAHNHGIIHRDIKSSNIMIANSGHVKIMDFGLAKLTGQSMITQMGTTLGTISYMSPEQSRGEEVDQRTDLWSLGIIIYEMLTGKLPFRGGYEQAIIYSILNEPAKPVKELVNIDVPPQFQQLMDQLLHKLPDERYHSAEVVITDLKRIKTSISTGVPVELIDSKNSIYRYVSQIQVPQISKKRNRLVPVVSSLAVIVLLVLALFYGKETLEFFGIGKVSGARHIAVLPFRNINVDQAIADGLVETITSKISQLEQFVNELWVIPASEIRKNKITEVEEAYRNFAVNLVLTGSIQPLTKGYRITINLVDAEKNRQITSRIIDDPLTSASFLQEEAIYKVAEMLNLELNPESLQKLKAGSTDNPEAYQLYLKGQGNLYDYDRPEKVNIAINFFDESIKLDSSFALAYAGLGVAYLSKYDQTKDIVWIEKATKCCFQGIALDKNLLQTRYTMGLIYAATGKYEEALKEFQYVLGIDPQNTDAYKETGWVYNLMGKIKEAEISYQKAIALKPDYWKLYNYLGYFYASLGNYTAAAEQYKEVVKLAPENASSYRNLGSIYYYLEKDDEAIEMFNKSLELNPDYRTYNNLAAIYVAQNKFQEAAKAYENILKLRDNDYRIWGYLADAYSRIPGQKAKCDSANQKAVNLAELQLDVNPNNQDVLSSLASYYGMLGQYEKAKNILARLKILGPTDVYIQFLIGDTYERYLNNREEGLFWIKKSLRNGYPVADIENRNELKNILADEGLRVLIDSVKSAEIPNK